MNTSYLAVAWLLFLTRLPSSMWSIGLVAVVGILFLSKRYDKKTVLFFLLCFCLMQVVLYRPKWQGQREMEGIVWQKKENSFLLQSGLHTVWVMTDIPYYEDTIVKVTCTIKPFRDINNRISTSWMEGARHKGYDGWCYATDIEAIQAIPTLRARIRQQVETKPEDARKLVEQFLFGFHNDEVAWGYLLSCGMHISYLIYAVGRVLGIWCDEKTVNRVKWMLLVVLTMIYPTSYFMHRILLWQICKTAIKDDKKQFGIYACLLQLWTPTMVHDIAFLIPVGMQLLSRYGRKHFRIASFLYVGMIQSWIYGSFAWLKQGLFMIIRPLFSWIWVLCFISVWVHVDDQLAMIAPLLEIGSLSFDGSQWLWIGKPGLIMMFVLYGLLHRLVVYGDRKTCMAMLVCLLMVRFQSYLHVSAMVTYVDVGQGDCTLIQLPFGRGNVLIDTGGNPTKDIGSNVVIPVLYSYGINRLDAVIITHDDMDHSGAYDTIAKQIKIEQVFRQREALYLVNGFPLYDIMDGLDQNEQIDSNEASLTTLYSLYGMVFFQCGDLPKHEEDAMIRLYDALQVDVFKLSHHGSNTSSSRRFLSQLSPKLTLISSGYQNRYRHPHPDVIERLKILRIPYENTAYEGAVEIRVWPHVLLYHTMSGRIGWLWTE